MERPIYTENDFFFPISQVELQDRKSSLANANLFLPQAVYEKRFHEAIGKTTTGALILIVRHGQSKANLEQAKLNELSLPMTRQLRRKDLISFIDSFPIVLPEHSRHIVNEGFSLTPHGWNQMHAYAEQLFNFLQNYRNLRRTKGQSGFLKIYFISGDGVRHAESQSIIKVNLRECFESKGVLVKEAIDSRHHNSVYFAPSISYKKFNEQQKGFSDKYLVDNPMTRYILSENFRLRRANGLESWAKAMPVDELVLRNSQNIKDLLKFFDISITRSSRILSDLTGEPVSKTFDRITGFDGNFFGRREDPEEPSFDDPESVFIFVTSQSTMDVFYAYLCRLSKQETYDMLTNRIKHINENTPKLQGNIGNGDQLAFFYKRVFPERMRSIKQKYALPFDLYNPTHAYTFLGLTRGASDEILEKEYGTYFLPR